MNTDMKDVIPARTFVYDPYFSIYSAKSSWIGSIPLEESFIMGHDDGTKVEYVFDEEVKSPGKVGWVYFPLDETVRSGVVIWNE